MGLIKTAKAHILSIADDLIGLDESVASPFRLGSVRLASLKSRVAANDPALLDPNRFLYLRSRAVSAGEWWGPNDNGDNFGNDELFQRHGTFVYTPSYVDHQNTDAADAIGIQIASVYHAGPRPGGWVEIIKALDRERTSAVKVPHLAGQPDLLTAIRERKVTDTSMGCFVEYSLCSICGNRAQEITDYCPHIRNHKGQMVQAGDEKHRLAYEDNHGVTFFEDSVISTRLDQGGGGADLNAKILSEVAARQMQRVASRHGHHWTELLVDRLSLCLEQESAMKRTAAPVNGPDSSSYHFTVMDEKRTTQVDTGDDPAEQADNKDAALFDQSQGKSAPSSKPTIIDNPENKLSQQTDEVDYPLPASDGSVPEPKASPGNVDKVMGKRTAEADPANLIGGKPDEVVSAEQAIEEAEADRAADHQDPGDAERTEDTMDARHAEEEADSQMAETKEDALPVGGMTMGQRFRRSVAKVLGIHVADVKDGEGIRVLQDYIVATRAQIADLKQEKVGKVSASARRLMDARINRLTQSMNRAIAKAGKAAIDPVYAGLLNKKAEQYGGNPQMLVDFPDVYEQGDPDHNLYEQSQGASPKEPAPAVGRGEAVAQETKADDHPVPQYGEVLAALKRGRWTRDAKGLRFTAAAKGRNIVLAGNEAGDVLDRITSLMEGPQRLSYEQAESKVFEQMAKRLTAAKRPVTAGQRPQYTGNRAVLMARLRRANGPEDEVEPPYGPVDDDDSDDSPYVLESNDPFAPPEARGWNKEEAKMRGRRQEAFMTDAEIHGRPVGRRQVARPEPYNMGKSKDPRGSKSVDVEGEIQGGNADTLASPATSGVVGNGGEFIRSTDGPANRKIQPYQGQRRRAMDDPEAHMEAGNGPKLESPATGDVSAEGNEYEAAKSGMDSMNNSTDPRNIALSTRDAVIERLRRENTQLRSQNRMHAVAQRKQAADALVREMVVKGMFTGNPIRQRQAASAEFVRLCKLSPERFAEARLIVARANRGTRVQEWNTSIPMARQGSVQVPVNQRAASADSDEQALGTMFGG